VDLPHPRTGVPFPSPVPPGAGWPGDPATASTPVARDAAEVIRLAAAAADLSELDARVSVCRACPRLVAWREEAATVKRRAYAGQPYWGRPVTGWGSPRPRILVLGLAPAAHGGNRTGRVFTGDRSGDELFAALHRAGLVNQSHCVDAGDGLAGAHIRIAAAVRCAPPANAPAPTERAACEPWLAAEWRMIAPQVRVIVALGGFAWRAALRLIDEKPSTPTRFGHGAVAEFAGADGENLVLLGSYHPSQQNMFTGRLTPEMLKAVLTEAASRAGVPPSA